VKGDQLIWLMETDIASSNLSSFDNLVSN